LSRKIKTTIATMMKIDDDPDKDRDDDQPGPDCVMNLKVLLEPSTILPEHRCCTVGVFDRIRDD